LGHKQHFLDDNHRKCFVRTLITYDTATNGNSLMQTSIKFYVAFGIPIMVLALLIAAPIAEEVL